MGKVLIGLGVAIVLMVFVATAGCVNRPEGAQEKEIRIASDDWPTDGVGGAFLSQTELSEVMQKVLHEQAKMPQPITKEEMRELLEEFAQTTCECKCN